MTEPLAEKVQQLVAAWRANRHLYPGWLTCPSENRERVWKNTRSWLLVFAHQFPNLALEVRLLGLYEMNWRLETALVPLWTDLAAAITDCLDLINPFPGQIDLPKATITFLPDNADRKDPPWSEIRRCWLELAFALLRFHREERHEQEFTKWTDGLGAICAQRPDYLSRLCYERSLYALGQMDDEAARRALALWPSTVGDLFWALRRAAILAELGEAGEATALTESLLAHLRVGLRHSPEDIPSLSREGWAMCLLFGLYHHRASTGEGKRPDFRGRWRQLASYRCNPWEELEFFELRLNQPVPLPKPEFTEKPSFHPGEYTRSRSFLSDAPDRLIPAYQYMRLVEEATFPPFCGSIGLSGKTLRDVAGWFIRYDPVRTQTLICRLADKELIEQYFKRHRVAWLSPQAIIEFHTIAYRAVLAAHPKSFAIGARGEDALASRADRILYAGIEILARLTVRLGFEQLQPLWTLAVNLYHSPVLRQSPNLDRPLGNLFRSLILSCPRQDLEQRFRELMALPIPGSTSFSVAFPDSWPEVVGALTQRLSYLPPRSQTDEWVGITNSLLVAAGEAEPAVRGRAILRLWILHEYNYLTSSETERLGQVYWQKVNENSQLPDVRGLPRWICLVLPEPQPGLSVERFRQFAIVSNLPPAEGGIVDASGLLTDLLHATKIPGRELSRRSPRRYVDWTASEAEALVDRMSEWWHAAGRAQVALVRSPLPHDLFGDSAFDERMTAVLDVLRYIVIPRLPSVSPAADKVLNLVADMEQYGTAVEAVLPALLLLRQDPEAAPRLRRGLASADRARYVSALRGLIHWLEYQPPLGGQGEALALPPPPQDLLHELGGIIAGRRQPDLIYALDAAGAILKQSNDTIDEQFRQSLVIGLEYLFSETAYRSAEDPGERIPYDEVPIYRAKSAHIATLLHSKFHETAASIQKWIETAKSDPLPEVREVARAASAAD